MWKKVPERVNDMMSETLKYHNDVPSFFCESELLNYNIITQKIKRHSSSQAFSSLSLQLFLSLLLLSLLSFYLFSDAVKTMI